MSKELDPKPEGDRKQTEREKAGMREDAGRIG